MTNPEGTRVALWTNHLNHWIIGYERDALAGYDSGFFYTVPETEQQKDCPHMDQMVWKKWITHWRRWGDVDPAFSVRCLGRFLLIRSNRSLLIPGTPRRVIIPMLRRLCTLTGYFKLYIHFGHQLLK